MVAAWASVAACLGIEGHGGAAHAEPEETVTVDEVAIGASRMPLPLSRVSAAATVLTQEDIQRTPYPSGTQIDDVLRTIPSVQPSLLSSRYNHPTAQAVSIRGLGTRRALVLLDGVPLNDAFGGWINWGLVPDRIARVEVIPGGGSNLYGTWAMGGIVNIVTPPAEVTTGASSDLMGGMLGTHTESVAARYAHGRVAVVLGYRHFDTTGFVTVPASQRGPIDRAVGSGHHHFTGSASVEMAPGTTVILSGTLFREERPFGTPLSQATRTIGMTSLGLKGQPAGWGAWEAKVFGQWQTFVNQSSTIVPAPVVRQSEQLERVQTIPSNDFGGMAQWTLPLGSLSRLVVGSDARAVLGQSRDRLLPSDTTLLARGKQLGVGTFGEWIAEPVDGLMLTASARWDWWKNFDGVRETATGRIQTPDNVASILNPKVSVLYAVTEDIRLGASVYQAFRAPTLNELYRDFSFGGFTFLSNARLAPERLTGAEAKLEADLLPNGRLGVRISGHYDVVKDQILLVTQGPAVSQRQNIGEGRSAGLDAELRSRIYDGLWLSAGYSFVDAVVTRFPGNPGREGLRIPNVSRHQVTAGVTVGSLETLQGTVLGRYLSRQYADDLNRQPVGDFIVLDASLRRRLFRGAELFVNGENLTDRRYIATQTGSVKTLGQPLLVLAGVSINL